MANQTNVHKKMDKILQKLSTLEDDGKALAKQTGYLAQLVILAKQDSQRMHRETQTLVRGTQTLVRETARESQAMARDTAQILLEVKRISAETEKQVAEILAGTRKH